MQATQTPTNAITGVLELLNNDPKTMYTLAYDPVQRCWKVYKLILLDKERSLYRAMPFASDHNTVQGALRDALILSAHYGETAKIHV